MSSFLKLILVIICLYIVCVCPSVCAHVCQPTKLCIYVHTYSHIKVINFKLFYHYSMEV